MNRVWWLSAIGGALGVWMWKQLQPAHVILSGKVVMVTGAARGIGLATCRAFAAQGAKVAIIDRNQEQIEALAEELREQFGVDAAAFTADLRDEKSLEQVVRSVMAAFSRIDVLVNNAATGTKTPTDDIEPDDALTRAIIDTNLRAVINLTKLVLPVMEAQQAGWIVNVSSVAALVRPPMHDVYTASKAGMDGFSDVLRRKYIHKGIRVLKVYPGLTFTPGINRGLSYEDTERYVRDNGLLMGGARMRLPEEVAGDIVNAVRYERASTISGNQTEKLMVNLARLFPGVVEQIFTRTSK